MIGDKRILIGSDLDHIEYDIGADRIKNVKSVMSVDFAGEQMPADELTPTVWYAVELQRIFRPTDVDGVMTADSMVLCGHYASYGLADIPFGTKMWFYDGTDLLCQMFITRAERTGQEEYTLYATSLVGMLDRQMHKGGVYTGETFDVVMTDILNAPGLGQINWYRDVNLGTRKVYGWLPYDTRKNNLFRLMHAYNCLLMKYIVGDILITYSWYDHLSGSKDADEIYVGGKYSYNERLSAAEVTEHSFRALKKGEPEVVYDNRGDAWPADHQTVELEGAPVIVSTITADEGITLHSVHPNCVEFSGQGRIYGTPYTHMTNLYRLESGGEQAENVKKVSDNCLINMTNSDFVAQRMLNYYNGSSRITSSMLVDGENTGQKWTVTDPFRSRIDAFVAKMTLNTSSSLKADCELLAGWKAVSTGRILEHWKLIQGNQCRNDDGTVTTLSGGVFQMPSEIFDKPPADRHVRIYIVGGGNGGEAGADGADGKTGTVTDKAYSYPEVVTGGGKGGKAGSPGDGGRMRIIDLRGAEIQQSYSYSTGTGGSGGERVEDGDPVEPGDGTDSVFGPWSTAIGDPLPDGVLNVLSGEMIGAKGDEGADGGRGAPFIDEDGEIHDHAEDVTYTYAGIEYTTPAGAYNGTGYGNFPVTHGGEYWAINGGPAGAAAGGTPVTDPYECMEPYELFVYVTQLYAIGMLYGFGGTGGDAISQPASTGCGNGGAGGHGGGGGGCGAQANVWGSDVQVLVQPRGGDQPWQHPVSGGTGGHGGNGGAGSPGGILIIY